MTTFHTLTSEKFSATRWTRPARLFALAAALLFHAGAYAKMDDQSATDITVDRASNVALVYVDDDVAFRTRLDIDALKRSGCTYVSDAFPSVEKLNDIVSAYRFQRESTNKMIEPRYALYIYKTDKTVQLIQFDKEYDHAKIIHGKTQGEYFSVNSEILENLRTWATSERLQQVNDQCVASKPVR